MTLHPADPEDGDQTRGSGSSSIAGRKLRSHAVPPCTDSSADVAGFGLAGVPILHVSSAPNPLIDPDHRRSTLLHHGGQFGLLGLHGEYRRDGWRERSVGRPRSPAAAEPGRRRPGVGRSPTR